MRPFIFICHGQSYILERINGTKPLSRRIVSNFEMEPRELACLISNLIMGEEGSTMFLKENILVSSLGMRKMYGKFRFWQDHLVRGREFDPRSYIPAFSCQGFPIRKEKCHRQSSRPQRRFFKLKKPPTIISLSG